MQIAAKIKIKTKEFPKNLQLFYLTFLSSKVETEGQAELASYVNLICTPLSLAGTFYMIHSYFKDYTRSFSSRLIFCLALSDLLLTICDMIDVFEPINSQNCTIVGFMRIMGIYSNMLWITMILSVLFVQFVLEFAGVDRLFSYLVITNILGSLAPNLVILLYSQNFGGELQFQQINGECFISPPSEFTWVLIIPFGTLLTVSCFLTLKVYLVFRNLETSLGNIEYKRLFSYPAVLVLLNVPISVNYAMMKSPNF